MKKLVVIGLFISTFSFAQDIIPPVESITNKHELGLNIFSITDLGRGNFHSSKTTVQAEYNLATGLYYKYHSGKNAWRASFNYYQKAIAVNNYIDDFYYFISAGVKKSEQFTAGYQREFGNGKFAPFVFSDLLFRYGNYSGKESYYGDITQCENCPFHREVFEYGIDAGFGFKYEAAKHITLSWETSVQGFYSVSEDLQYPQNGKFRQFDNRLNPLSQLGFAVTF
jgi:hypothetical protein